nr:hypothetical protein [Tanacetum cinerariifolium]
MEKFFHIFHDLHFDISFADALLLKPKFASAIKSLLENKDKLFDLAKVLLNENCMAMLLKKLPEKLGDPKLTPTQMTLELADRSITRPKGVAEDVFVKVGKFHFLTDFVVVDFEADPIVPLILGSSFLRTGHALIDVYGEEITLRIIRRCVHGQEAFEILKACHEGPSAGHHGTNLTAKKGIDFMGLFPSSKGNKDILVVVDYLSKWVEVKALPTNDARVVVKFLKYLFSRFGTPRAIISDHGTHFCNDQFTRVMIKYRVTHWLATSYHPQTSGQVKVSNYGLKRILERTVGENHTSWSDKLDDALWTFRTAYETLIGCTPYKLVYGKSCHLPIVLEHKAYWALKHVNFDLKTTGDHRKLQLNELNFLGKLKTRWSGPFTITRVFPYGTIELSQSNGPNFKVNGHRVKHYFGGDVPSNVAPDLHTFPMDN